MGNGWKGFELEVQKAIEPHNYAVEGQRTSRDKPEIIGNKPLWVKKKLPYLHDTRASKVNNRSIIAIKGNKDKRVFPYTAVLKGEG